VALDPLAEQGFGSDLRSALIYERGRPGYASAMADALAAEFGLDADSAGVVAVDGRSPAVTSAARLWSWE
jgi:hypothetical protein